MAIVAVASNSDDTWLWYMISPQYKQFIGTFIWDSCFMLDDTVVLEYTFSGGIVCNLKAKDDALTFGLLRVSGIWFSRSRRILESFKGIPLTEYRGEQGIRSEVSKLFGKGANVSGCFG